MFREGQADGKDTLIPLSGKQGEHRGFPVHTPYYNGYFDVVSSNIPFGNTRVYDRDFDRSDDPVRKSSLAAVHNYFFLKGMDTLREGGILAYITTSGVMDSPQNRPVRECW